MARVGEGDPRWIVQNRADGANVNSWHWEEKDLTRIVHDALRDKFKTAPPIVENDTIKLGFTELSEINGDVTVAQRKGKIMCYFELQLTAAWKGSVNEAGKEDATNVEGKLSVPEIEHDNFREDFDINLSTMDRNAASSKAEDDMRGTGRRALRSIVKEYFEALFEQYHVGQKVGANGPVPQPPASASSPPKMSTPSTSSSGSSGSSTSSSSSSKSTSSSSSSKSGEPTKFSWDIKWQVPAEELFATLIDERRATGYTRGPAKIDPRPAGTFSYLGGTISGYYGELVPSSKIIMQWRLDSWPPAHFSSVVMEFKKEDSSTTKLSFSQAGIPAGEVDRVKQGWSMNFFEPIKLMLGYQYSYI